jgi:hypothetical protein
MIPILNNVPLPRTYIKVEVHLSFCMDVKLFNHLGEHMLRTSWHKQMRINLGPVRVDVTGKGENCKIRSYTVYILHQTL